MKVQWKKLATLCAFALMATTLVGAETPRAEWLGKVGDCAKNAVTMTDTMSSVSAADQVALVNAVNAALAKMPGSNEQRAAAYVRANLAAVTAAMVQNKEKHAANQVIAEVFATVPPEYLTVVSEKLAQTVLNRKNMKKPLFITITTNTLHVITERCEKGENAGVREAFAALTFLKGMGEQPTQSDINTMLSQMGDQKSRETAASEWIGPALGTGGNVQSYDPMLGAANAGDEPDHSVVDQILAADGNGGGNGGNNGGNTTGGTGNNNPANTTNNGKTDGTGTTGGNTGTGTGTGAGTNGGNTGAGTGTGAGAGTNGGNTGAGTGTGAGAGTNGGNTGAGTGTGAGAGTNGGNTGAGTGAGAGAGTNGGNTGAGTGAGAGAGTAGGLPGAGGAGAGGAGGDVVMPNPTMPAGGSDISVALLGELGGTGSGMQTPADQMGGGALNQPGQNLAGDLAGEINAANAARPAVNNPDPIGGNADGPNADGGDPNPYYRHGRGGSGAPDDGNGGGGTGGYKGQALKAW